MLYKQVYISLFLDHRSDPHLKHNKSKITETHDLNGSLLT